MRALQGTEIGAPQTFRRIDNVHALKHFAEPVED
jgi:hypothetical protein